MYLDFGVVYHRRYFQLLLRKLYQADCVKVNLPSRARVHLVKREAQKQYVLHLLYGAPMKRGGVEVLEDFPTLYHIDVKIQVPEKLRKITLIPQNTEIPFEKAGEEYSVQIPELTGHQMAVLEY